MRFPHPQRSTLGVGALVVAGLATTQALNGLLPDDSGTFGEGLQRPFVRQVAEGGTVELRSGTVTVTAVEGATTMRQEFRVPVTTAEVFVLVRFDWTARGRADGIARAVVTDRAGRRFVAETLGSTRDKVACPTSTPGVTQECSVVVELPRDALAGATMTLENSMWDQGYDDIAQLDLGVTDDEAEAFGRGATASLTSTYKGLA